MGKVQAIKRFVLFQKTSNRASMCDIEIAQKNFRATLQEKK